MIILISYILTAISLLSMLFIVGYGFYHDLSHINENGYNIYLDKHISYAFSSIILYSFSQTIIMFYFIGSGKKIKETIIKYNLEKNIYKKVLSIKKVLFPHITINIFLIGTAFIIGGAVHTMNINPLWHSALFILGILHYIRQIFIQHYCFIDDRLILENLWKTIEKQKK